MSPSRSQTSPSKLLRINRLLSERGVASRRKAEELIRSGKVKVNGEVVTDLSAKFPENAKVHVEGRIAKHSQKRLFLFYKPRSVVTTLSDPEGRKCIADFLDELSIRVYPVGRLDYDVSGLLLLTNDGDFAEQMLHPRFGIEREYIARVKGTITDEILQQMTVGLPSDGETLVAKSVALPRKRKAAERLVGEPKAGEELLTVTVTEGSKHFVKRLLSAAGFRVQKLSRIRFGDFRLGDLQPGEIREVPHGASTAR